MTQVCFVLQLPVVLELLHQLGNKKSGGGNKQWKAFTDLKDRFTFKARSIPSDADEEGCGEGRQMHRGASVASVPEMVPVSPSATESNLVRMSCCQVHWLFQLLQMADRILLM